MLLTVATREQLAFAAVTLHHPLDYYFNLFLRGKLWICKLIRRWICKIIPQKLRGQTTYSPINPARSLFLISAVEFREFKYIAGEEGEEVMSNVMRQLITERQRIVARDKFSEEDEDVSFHFFDDGSTVNIGIGTEVDPTIRLAHIDDPEPPIPSEPVEPADKVEPQSESEQATQDPEPASLHQDEVNLKSDQVISPTDEIKPNSGLIIAAAEQSDKPEPDSSSIDDLKEQISKSAKLFEDTRSHISSHKITVNQSTHSIHSAESIGFLDIEGESVEAPLLPFDDVEKLEAEYVKPKDNVGRLTIDGKPAAPHQSSTKSREPWAVRVFIVAPIKGLFHALYDNGIMKISKFIGVIFLFLLLSGIATVVYNAHKTGQPPLEIALQLYSDAKEFLRVVYSDISSAIRGN